MSNLLGSLRSTAETLDVLQQGVAVAQNNVMNANTAGYVRQRVTFQAREFNPTEGLLGGVDVGQYQSSRDAYVEQTVRTRVNDFGKSAQDVQSLTVLENVFPVNDSSGVPASLNRLLQTFSAWSLTPNSTSAQQNVKAAAETLGSAFRASAGELSRVTIDTNERMKSTVQQVNSLVGRVQLYNARRQDGATEDPGLDAQVHDTLERLAQLADVKAIRVDDGTYTLLLDGQRTLLSGARQNTLALRLAPPVIAGVPNAGAPPQAYIFDETTQVDVSAHVRTGELGSLMNFRNKTLPIYQGDAQSTGLLNRVAREFADRVNAILSPGTPLFVYDTSSPVKSASTMSVNPLVDLTAIPADGGGVTNGKLLQLAGLAAPVDPLDRISGTSYPNFLGQITSSVGQLLSDAKSLNQTQQQLTTQARSLRAQLSGVSLDEEAVRLVEFQRAYQATSRMASVINDMTDIVMNLFK